MFVNFRKDAGILYFMELIPVSNTMIIPATSVTGEHEGYLHTQNDPIIKIQAGSRVSFSSDKCIYLYSDDGTEQYAISPGPLKLISPPDTTPFMPSSESTKEH